MVDCLPTDLPLFLKYDKVWLYRTQSPGFNPVGVYVCVCGMYVVYMVCAYGVFVSMYVCMYVCICLSVYLSLCVSLYGDVIQIQTRRTSGFKRLRKPSLLLCEFTGWVMKPTSWGWREGSVVKSTGSCPGPRFNSQHPHDGSQLPVTPVPGDPMSSSGFCEHCMHMLHRHTCRQSNRMQNKNF